MDKNMDLSVEEKVGAIEKVKVEAIKKVTDLVFDISLSDKAICAKPESPNIPLCTFLKDDEPQFTLAIGQDEFGNNRFHHYRGNNKDLGLRYYEDEDVDVRKKLFRHSDFPSGGVCFTDDYYENYPISKEKCIIETSGLYEAVSRDEGHIFIKENLEE